MSCNKKTKKLLRKGFSLLEIVLSMAIGTMILGSFSAYVFSIKLSLEREIKKANMYITGRSKGFVLVPILFITSLITMFISSGFSIMQDVIRIDGEENCKAKMVLALDAYSRKISLINSEFGRNNIVVEKYLKILANIESPEAKEISDIYQTKIIFKEIIFETENIFPFKIKIEIHHLNSGNKIITTSYCPQNIFLYSEIEYKNATSSEIIKIIF